MKPDRKLEHRGQWLQWVLDFVQEDLNSLSERKKEKLVDELVYFTYDIFPAVFPVFENFDFYKEYYKTHHCPPPQDRTPELRERFALAESGMKKIQKDLRSMLASLQEAISTKSEEVWKDYPLCESLALLSLGSYFTEGEERFQMRFKPKRDKHLGSWAKLRFAELLGGLPAHAITRCKGCGTYFLNLTERKGRIYCTPSCASRSCKKQWRKDQKEKDPVGYEAYLKKQNEYGMARYRKKVKEKYGRNVKVGRKKRSR